MENWGLVGNMASGIREFANTYQTIKNQKKQEQMMGLLQGVQQNPETGSYEFTPEEKAKREAANKLSIIQSQEAQSKYQPFTDQQRQLFKSAAGYDLPQGMTPAQYELFKGIHESKIKGQALADQTGRKAVDTDFAKKYNEYEAEGGKAHIDKNIALIESAIADLEGGKVKTGEGYKQKAVGLLGDKAIDTVSPEISKVRDTMRSAIQESLKPILGAQFAMIEGEQIMSRAFNPRLPTEENIRRAKVELEALKSKVASKDEAIDFYRKNKTLHGFVPGRIKKQKQGLIEKPKLTPEQRAKMIQDLEGE